jgi:outer membrane protein TolC
MKKVLFNLVALFIFLNGFCQNKAALLNFRPIKSDIDSIAEMLADIALQSPAVKSLEADTKSEEYTYRISKLSLLNNIAFSGNLNEFSIRGNPNNTTGRNFLFPRYNLGIRIPVGDIVTYGANNKSNYYKYESQVEKLKDARQNIRVQVISAYQNYAATQKTLAFQQEILQDGLVALTKAEESFRNGELSLELYTNASRAFNNEQVREVGLTRDLKVQQAAIEALIGMPLHDAFNHIRATSK